MPETETNRGPKEGNRLAGINHSELWTVVFIGYLLLFCGLSFGKVWFMGESEGDYGRDLYYFYLVSKGSLPYIDFNWIYGPIMPLLYGVWYKIVGISVLKAQILWDIFFVGASLWTYFSIRKFSDPLMACVFSVFFTLYYGLFFQTFNHIGGAFFLSGLVYSLISLMKTEKKIYAWLTAIFAGLFTLVKLNMGLGVIFLTVGILIALVGKNKKLIAGLGLTCISVPALVYGGLILLSPMEQLSKSFPYSSNLSKGIPLILKNFLDTVFRADFTLFPMELYHEGFHKTIYTFINCNAYYFTDTLIALLVGIWLYRKSKIGWKELVFTIYLSALAFYLAHEFILVNTSYSLRVWSLLPATILLAFVFTKFLQTMEETALKKAVLYAVVATFVVILPVKFYYSYVLYTTPSFFIENERARVSTKYKLWRDVFAVAMEYVEKNVKPGEKLLTLPNGALINFVSQRDFPGRDVEFLYITELTPEDQQEIINTLEQERVKTIIYADKPFLPPNAADVVVFGEDYNKELYTYIQANYKVDLKAKIKEEIVTTASLYFYKRKTAFRHKKVLP